MMKKIIIFGLCIIFLYFLLSKNSTNQTSTSTFHNSNSSDYLGNSNEDENLDYEDEDTLTFRGYECTEDCSGHEAGYEWAEEKGIDDPEDCGGNSGSFIEGCQAYAEENY